MQRPADSLAEEYTAMHRLHALLEQEQSALTGGAIDALPELINAKAHLIAQIAALADARHKRLADAGLDASEESMQRWIDSSGAPDEKQHWTDLLQLAQATKEQNRLNGLIINKHMQINQQTLNIFEGAAAGNNFYGPDGQSSIKTNTRKFGAV
jgi:flagella synthesis protein FlgN